MARSTRLHHEAAREKGEQQGNHSHECQCTAPFGRSPFVAVSCAAIPANLLEAELFGHVRGAFTDARSERKGLCLQADGGTLFLDEIGEVPLELQPKLLRALEDRRVRPVGAGDEVSFDTRLVSATNRDIEAAIEHGYVREDLYFRLNVINIVVPPLRTRGTDVLVLARRFLEEFATKADKDVKGMSDTFSRLLLDYDWPGNVRELRNAMERAVTLAQREQLIVDDLPERIRDFRGSYVIMGSTNPEELVSLAEVERRYIMHVLDAVNGNKALAARLLGLDRKTLYRKLKAYEGS